MEKYQGVREYIDKCFENVLLTKEVKEVKAELVFNMENKINDHIEKGGDFQEAYNMAIKSLGDMDEFVLEFTPLTEVYDFPNNNQRSIEKNQDREINSEDSSKGGYQFNYVMLCPLSVFVFLGLGFLFDWWYFAWVIIPITAITVGAWEDYKKKGKFNKYMLVAYTPFIYILLGFWFGMWAFGWVIIPLSAIFLTGFEKPSNTDTR